MSYFISKIKNIKNVKKYVHKKGVKKYMYKNYPIFLTNRIITKLYLRKKKKLINRFKERYKVSQIWIGHFHYDFFQSDTGLKIYEAFVFRNKIYKTNIGYIIADVHLGIGNYTKSELSKINDIILSGKKLYILGDLTEWRYPISILNEAEKEFLDNIINGIINGNVVYIRGNHDNPALKNYWKEYVIIDNILLTHGDFLLQDPLKPKC